MVAGDFDDPASLAVAFKGASAIFSVTDYWNPMADVSQHQKAAAAGQKIGLYIREYETQQNKNIIDAAAQVDGLERFIFSSLPDTNKLSGGKYTHVYQFDSKGRAEEYGRVTYPHLWEKTSVFYAPFYLENYFGPLGALFRPKLVSSHYTGPPLSSLPSRTLVIDKVPRTRARGVLPLPLQSPLLAPLCLGTRLLRILAN